MPEVWTPVQPPANAELLPPPYRRIVDFLDHNRLNHPTNEALIDESRRLSWRDTVDQVDELAARLLQLGLRHGDRLAVLSPPCIEGLLLYFACMRLGAMYVGLNPKYTLAEAQFVVDDAAPRLLVLCGDLPATAPVNLDVVDTCTVVDLRETGAPRVDDADLDQVAGAMALVRPEDPLALVYTSGTTGRPKGAFLTQWGLAHNYWWMWSERWCDPFRTLAHSPLNHLAGLADVAALALLAAGAQVMMPRFEPDEVVRLVPAERITYLFGTPTHYQLLLRAVGDETVDFSSIQFAYWGGAPISVALLEVLESWAPHVGSDYGSTELNGGLTFIRPTDSREVKLHTIGRPIGPYRARVADETGRELPDGEVGELQAWGNWHSPGYLNLPEATAELFTSDGWLRTGDLCRKRTDGMFEMAGRAKEMFKSGGYNVYPREVELAVESHPEVEQAAVVPVPDPLWSEVGHCYVTVRDGSTVSTAQLRAHSADRLANYKVPKAFTIIDEMPRLEVGKVDRSALRQQALAEGPEAAK